MTIRRGEPWGRLIDRPPSPPHAPDDLTLARLLADGPQLPVLVTGGDLARTLGVDGSSPARELADDAIHAQVRELPIDLIDVGLDDRPVGSAVAHVVARRPAISGGCWRGEVFAAMNAEFYDDFDVAPRGHPNDGRIELFHVDPRMSMRDRRAARQRLPTGGHVPHPRIATRSVRATTVEFRRPLEVLIDHRSVGMGRRLTLTVRPDAAIVLA